MGQRVVVIALFVLALAACERTDGETPTEPAPTPTEEPVQEETAGEERPAEEEAPAEDTAPAEALPGGWQTVDETALTDAQRAQLEQATAARQSLASQLFERLSTTIQSDGHVAAISVCQGAAPELAASVATEMGLRIGRTSFKLRNPANQPPEWAEPLVDARVAEAHYAAGPDGQLGVLAPIRVAAPCLACHGEPESLAPGVSEAVAEHYAEDQATGFAQGDLRGWFWVEVP